MLFLIFIHHFLAFTPPNARAADSSLERIHQECIPAWRQGLELGTLLQGTVIGTFENSLGRSQRTEITYKKLNSNRLLHFVQRSVARKGDRARYVEEIWGSNVKYSFRLQKKEKDESWVLLETVAHANGLFPAEYSKQYGFIDYDCTMQYRFGYESFLDVFTHPDCKLLRAEEVRREGQTLVLVDFSTTAPALGPYKDHVKKGKVELDPRMGWVMIHGEWEEDNGRFTSKVARNCLDYYDAGGIYVPKKVITTQVDQEAANGNSASRDARSVRTLSTSSASLTINDFTLSKYGFIEPHGVTWPKPTPYWLYGTLGSVAVIVLGILLMRWSQRRSARAAG